MLTEKQHQLLTFLIEHQAEHDISPSFDEMRQAVGLASKSGIHRLISGLEERGYIRKLAQPGSRHRNFAPPRGGHKTGKQYYPPGFWDRPKRFRHGRAALAWAHCRWHPYRSLV